MDYREEIAGIGDVVGQSIAFGSRAKSESNMVDSLLDRERSRIVGELEEKGVLRLNESGSLGVSPSKHEEVGVFERPSFTNADPINGSFPEQESSSKVREQSDENQTVNAIDGTGENEQGTFPELSKATFRLKEERNTESIESCPPNPEVHHHTGNETVETSVEDGKITKITVPEVLPRKEIETEDVNEDAPIVVVEKDGTTEEPEIITYRGRDIVEEGYRGNLPKVGLENEKGEEIGIFSSNEDVRKPVTEGGDETDCQIEGIVDKVDVEVPNEEVAPGILNVKDDSVDGLPSAEVSSLRDKILDEDEILKTSNDDEDEINFGNHKEEDVQEDDVIVNDGLSKDRELTTIETAAEETGRPAPGAPSNGDSASHPENDFAEGGKNEGSEADSTGITREITDQVAIERDDASPDSNVYTEAIDGDLVNDPFSVPELTQDEFQPDITEKEAPSGATASNEFDIAGEEDTSSGLTLSGDQTTKDYEEVSSRASSSEVVQEKAAEVSTVQADTVPGRDNDTEAHSVKDDDTGTGKEDETLESTDREAETDDASDPIEREVPIVADSLGDFVQQETRVIPPEQESFMETSARSSVVENFAEERNASEEALSTLEDQPLDVPGASSEVKHESEESNISKEVHLHAGLSALTDGAIELRETQTANMPEVLAEEKFDVDQRSAELDAEISSAVPVDSNIDGQLASHEASNYEEASAAEAAVTESKIPDEEKILKKSFEQLKQAADEIDEDGKPTLTEGESERELDEVRDREKVLEDANTSSGNELNDTLEKSETEMNTKQPHDMADQGSHSDDQLASNENPKYEESSVAAVVTNSMILEEKILARSFDGEYEAQIGQDADEVEKYEETAAGRGNSAREHDEVPAREEVPSVLDETIVDGVQQRDIANQTDIPLTEATVETTEKATVYDSAIDASTDNQGDISHFGTMTHDQELETNQKRDEPTNDVAASTLQDGTKIDTQTEETSDITLSETTDEVASKIQEDDSFGVAGELSENPIDGQSAFGEASNYEEASAAEVVVTESKIPEETATEEQLRQDTNEIDDARELDEAPNREVLEATNASARNAPNEKFEQLKTEVSGEQPHYMADQGDVALTEVPGESIKKDGVDTTIPLVDQKDGRGDDQLASNEDPKHGESSVAEAVTEREILEERILTRSFNDSLEGQIGQDADEAEKHRETALGEGNTAREHDEVPAREEVPSVLDETIVDGAQQQDIADQTDIAPTEATVETTEKAAVYDSATDASTNDQRDLSHLGTLTQDQELKTNKKQDEPTDDDAASTCWDFAKIDTQTEETSGITLSETTDEVASKIQEDDSFGVAGEVLENPIEESVILPDETIKSEEISGERRDVEEPALGQGDKGSSLVDDNINANERGIVGSSEFTDAADSVQEIKEDSLQTEDVNEPLTVTGITEDKDPTDIVEKDLIDGTESDEKIDAGEVALDTKDISSREVGQFEQHVGESASRLQVGFSETPESEPSFDQTVVVDQTEEERKEIYDSNDRDGEIEHLDVHQSSVNEAPVEQTKEEKAAEEVDSNIVSGTKTGITDTEPSQISRDVDTESFEERNSATENTENKEYFYEEGKYNIESKDRAKEVIRSEELVDAKETSDEAVFSHSELVESAVAEEGILDQGIGTENSYERDSSLVPPEENEVKDQEVPLGAATDSFSERQKQDKEAREPYEEIPHPEQRDLLVDITEADYDRGTSSAIPYDTQELSKLEGDIQKDEACIENKVEASENEGIRGLPPKDQQENAQGILAEEVDLEGEIASKDVETDRIVQEDKKGNKEAENSREANEDEINKDGEVDMGSSTINEESLATVTPATEMADLVNKNSYTTADNSHVEVIEGEKRDLNLSNEIAEEGDSYSAGADTPFSERSISDTQPGMSSENLDGENAGELNASAESVEDVIATEAYDETALSNAPNETATTLQTQPTDHSYEQDSLESAPVDDSTIEFNRENEQDRQDKMSDEKSSRVEIDNPELGTDTPMRDVPATAENIEINLAEMNEQTTGSSDVGEQKISEEAFFQVDNSLPPEAEVVGIESNEVLQNEAETTEGGSAEEAPQLAHYTEISSDGPPDEMSAFSTSVPNDVQEREIREIVASEDDQTSRTIQEVSEHSDVDGVASADVEADLVKSTQPTQSTGKFEESIAETSVTVMPDENDDSNEESFIVENQITSEQILESNDQQIELIPSGEAVQEDSDIVESASVGESTLDENPLLCASEKESESEGTQSNSTKEAWSDGKELTLQTDISQDESDIGISKYADKERDVTETEEITPLELGDRGFTSAVQTKEISTDEEASKIKEVVSEDAGESIDDAIREVIPVTSDTQPSMSSGYLDGENAGELNPTTVSVEDGAGEEEGTDAGIEEASEALIDSKGHEEQATGQRELINVTEVSNEAVLSDVPDETAVTIQTVPADDLYERDSVERTEESKVHVESATADGSTIECYGNTEPDIEDKTSNEQTSQEEIDNRDLAADMTTRDVLATAENVEIDRAAFDERTTMSSDIGEQKITLVEEVERDQSRELSTSEEAFIQTAREDISLPPEVEVGVGGSESNEVLQKEAETKEGGSVEEAPQFAHSTEISSDGPSVQIPALSASVPDDVQEIKTPEIVTLEDDQTNRTILKELDNDSGNKVEQEDNAENEEKEIGIVHTQECTSNKEKPLNGVSVEETIASDQLTQEEESNDSRSGENIGEFIKDVYTDVGGVAAVDAVAGSVKPTEPTESTGNLENESIGETSETVMPDENDDSKEESFVEPIPHEGAVIAETEDVEPVSVGESTLDQSPLADVSREESTLLHARTEAWSDGNESTLQTDVRQDESDTSMSKFADNERGVQEREKITPLELGNRDFALGVQTKEVLTEEDTSKIKEVVSEGVGESVNDAIREVIPMTSDTQPSMSGEHLDSENVEELNSAAVLVKDSAGKEESTDAGIEETSEALINSNGHEVEASGQRDLVNATEVSDEAALLDAPNETAATIQTVPTTDSSAMEFYGENEQEVQDKTFNEQASQVEIDNQELAADMPTMDVPATLENVEIDRAKLDEQTNGIGSSLPPEAETGGNERNQVLQNEAETKEEFSGEEALQSTEISSDGPSDQMSAFSTSVPDAVQEREIRKIVVSEDDQTSRTIQEKLDDESQNKFEQEDKAEKVEQEFASNEERPANGESVEETISSDLLAQSGGKESNGSLGGENVSEVIKDVYADVGGVPAADAEADITKTTQPTQITGNLEEESIEKMSATVMPDENYDSKEQNLFEPVPHEEATLVETEDVEPASIGESTLEQNPLSDVSRDESTLIHAQTDAWPDGNKRALQTGVRQDESDNGMPKYAEKEIDVPATGKIAPLELGDIDFTSTLSTKEILTEEDASKNEEVESVDVAVDHTEEQPSVTTGDTILKDKEVRDDTEHATGKPEDMIETYEDKTSASASVVNTETTIPRGNEAAAEVGKSLDDAIGEVIPMTSDSSSAVPKEGEILAAETEHGKENASLEISQRNLTDTADLKDININEMAANIPSTDGQVATGSVSDLPQGSIDAITAASVDQENASLTLPAEETVADKAWTSRESPEDEHLELGFKETGTGDDTAEQYGKSRSLDFTSVQADQETKNEINGDEILSDGCGADKADYGLASEAVEIADKVDPSLKEKEEKAIDEAQILQEKASPEQDEYKQGAADEDKAPILSDANDPVEGTVDRSPPEEAEGQTFDSVEGDRKMEAPVPNIQGSSEEIFEGDRTPALEESKGLNQVIESKEDSPTEYHDSVLPRDASLVKEVTANLPGSTKQGLPPAETREFRDQSEVNLDSKEFEGEKFSADATTVPQTPVADNLQLPEQSPIIKPDENEEHEDNDHEHIEHSDAAPLMGESFKDVVDGKALHKKSHNHLLSGMSSKVKSSISKMKKVITGKSSNHNKEHSPKHGQ